LDDPEAMKSFIALKKANQRGKPKLDGIQIPKVSPADVEKVLRGAAHALKRLETEEAEANQQLQLAKKSGDAQQVEYLTGRWLKLTTQLRAYDQAVEQARRDAGELIPRQEVTRGLEWLAQWLKLSFQRLSNCAPTLASITEPAEVQRELDAKVSRSFWSSIQDAARMSPDDLTLWMVEATVGALHSKGVAPSDE